MTGKGEAPRTRKRIIRHKRLIVIGVVGVQSCRFPGCLPLVPIFLISKAFSNVVNDSLRPRSCTFLHGFLLKNLVEKKANTLTYLSECPPMLRARHQFRLPKLAIPPQQALCKGYPHQYKILLNLHKHDQSRHHATKLIVSLRTASCLLFPIFGTRRQDFLG